jgi:hypothetical protein
MLQNSSRTPVLSQTFAKSSSAFYVFGLHRREEATLDAVRASAAPSGSSSTIASPTTRTASKYSNSSG